MTLRDRAADVAYARLEAVAEVLAEAGVEANHVTLISFVSVVAAALTFAFGSPWSYLAAAAVLAAAGLLDLLDGELARLTGEADSQGDLLDHSLDRFADAALLLGVAAATEWWSAGFFSVAAVLLTAYAGTQAQAVGVGRVYRGVLTRADVFAVVVAASLLEAGSVSHASVPVTPFEAALAVTAVAGLASAVQRSVYVWRQLEDL